MQFDRLQDKDPNACIANFLEICSTIKTNEVADDAIRLRLLSFLLWNWAKQWLNSFMRGPITIWPYMADKFLMKYFPPAKTTDECLIMYIIHIIFLALDMHFYFDSSRF